MASSQLEEDSDFGEFGEFTEEVASEAGVPAVDTLNLGGAPRAAPRSSAVRGLSDAELRSYLVAPPPVTQDEIGAHGDSTATSQQLWQHLTETTWMPLPQWDGSPIHRQLALCLGVPLNLDKAQPQTHKSSLDLPTQSKQEIDGLQHIPEWALLTEVNDVALDHMSPPEMEKHLSQLAAALSAAQSLREKMEAREMDLVGEKHILEGMVESLLVFSQRKQREKLQRAKRRA